MPFVFPTRRFDVQSDVDLRLNIFSLSHNSRVPSCFGRERSNCLSATTLSTRETDVESERSTMRESTLSLSLIGFIGSGAVAGALARAFTTAGQNVVAVSSRRTSKARELAASIPGCSAVSDPQAVVESADLVFLAVPDMAIESTSNLLAWRSGMAAVHCSGAHSVDVLSSAAQAGAMVGGFHPLQTFAGRPDDAERIAGSVIGIEADEPLRTRLSDLACGISGRPVYLSAENKSLYHASAVLISNYVVTLAALAAELWATFDVPRDEALGALLPLLSGAVANLDQVGLPDALTGPIARGDVTTVEGHLRSMAQFQPQLVPLYRELGYKTLDLALERGLNQRSADAIRTILACSDEDDAVPN
jgi:predicted short-subunit dehydrogenase-like oxidoreductase (DUF2520 family)